MRSKFERQPSGTFEIRPAAGSETLPASGNSDGRARSSPAPSHARFECATCAANDRLQNASAVLLIDGRNADRAVIGVEVVMRCPTSSQVPGTSPIDRPFLLQARCEPAPGILRYRGVIDRRYLTRGSINARMQFAFDESRRARAIARAPL